LSNFQLSLLAFSFFGCGGEAAAAKKRKELRHAAQSGLGR